MTEIELSRRRVLGAVAATGLAAAGAGAGTMAALSDGESSSGNNVQSGALNLTLDGGDATVEFLSAANISPGSSGVATVTVTNNGSVPGYLDIEVASLTVAENACVNNENRVDNTCGDPGTGQGELQTELEITAAFQNGPQLWTGADTVANKLSAGTVYDLDYEIPAGGSDTFELTWSLPQGASEAAQSDSLEFELTFSLDQQPDTGL